MSDLLDSLTLARKSRRKLAVQDISPRKSEFDDFSLSQNPCHNFSTCFYGNLIYKTHVSYFPDSFLFGQKLDCFDVASCYKGVTANIAGCNNKHLGRVTTNSNPILSQPVNQIGLKFYTWVSMV